MEEETKILIIMTTICVTATLICLYTIYCGLRYKSIKIITRYGDSRKTKKEEPMMFWFYFGLYVFFSIVWGAMTIGITYTGFLNKKF